MTGLAWLAGTRDLRWRWRRFLIALGGTALTLAVTLLLSGFRAGFDLEAGTSVRTMGADGFVVQAAQTGPFTTIGVLDETLADRVARLPGVTGAAPVVTARHAIDTRPALDVYLVGARPGGLGAPAVSEGRAAERPGEAVVDARARRKVGDRFTLAGRTFTVVGKVRGASVWGGVPTVYVTLEDAQAVVFGGRPAATAILTKGRPTGDLPGTKTLTARQARADFIRPLKNAVASIGLLQVMLWVVAAAIIGSVLYISAIERSREFAVCKAFGTSSADLVAALALQALLLTTVAALAAVALARPLAGLFPAVVSLTAGTAVLLFAVAAVMGLAGSLAGIRRALVVDPATAFAGP
ncbi:MAG TPA: ABC transporter permease [Acidimicrobiales bacterium]|nr:ABC transporter permease [Acidimicrobiales bacterium]